MVRNAEGLIALKVTIDAIKKLELEKKIFSYGPGELSGIHVSNLVYCLRKSYFRKVNPKMDTAERTYHLLRGKSHHQFLEVLPLHEVEISRDPMATVDMTEEGIIYEVKSTLGCAEKPKPHWIEQLMYYIILSKTPKREHYLVIFRVAKPDLIVYRVDVFEDDIKKYTEKLWVKYHLLKKAMEQSKPSLLPPTQYNWYCEKCEYKKECEEIS